MLQCVSVNISFERERKRVRENERVCELVYMSVSVCEKESSQPTSGCIWEYLFHRLRPES